MKKLRFFLLFICALTAIRLWPGRPLLDGYAFSSAVWDRDGRLLRLTLAADGIYRLRARLADISKAMREATLAYEDRWFYWHPGVNPVAVARAIRTGTGGASTITMQTARLMYGIDSKTIAGKFKQMALAVWMELRHSKREILEAYLNIAPYGHNIEGVGAAGIIYFDETPARLSPPSARALAVVPQNPTKRAPDTGAEANAKARRMLSPETPVPVAARRLADLPFFAPHFTTAVLRERSGNVNTTLDLPIQRKVERLITEHIRRHANLGVNNAAALLVDWRTMEIVAHVGSADFGNAAIFGQVDGVRAYRSPGSAMKPLLYAVAADKGLIHQKTLLADVPRRFGAYTPENFDRSFYGALPADKALVLSRNVPAVDLLAQTGLQDYRDLLSKAGVRRLKSADHYGLALALGGFEVTMEDAARLYAGLRNQGIARNLKRFKGEKLNETRIVSAEAAFLVMKMLEENPPPDRIYAKGLVRKNRVPAYWKTGTSYGFKDAVTAGVAGPYVLAVWLGNFDGKPNPAFVGGKIAAPLWFAIVRALDAKDVPLEDSGLNVRQVDVCKGTGGLPNRDCPARESAWFIPGVSPIRVSDVHRRAPVDRRTGKRACRAGPDTQDKVFEFWPTDIAAAFVKAGVSRAVPPPFGEACVSVETPGRAPAIELPTQDVYRIRADKAGTVPFRATTDAGAGRVYWFVDAQFAGDSRPGEVLSWPARPGRFTVLAVDDTGKSASVTMTVTVAE